MALEMVDSDKRAFQANREAFAEAVPNKQSN
jgi:hypothetical protein